MCRTKYGFYFADGAGHLFVERLGKGNQGETQLVWSTGDQNLYVRKQPTGEVSACEICMIRQHRLIPQLTAHAEHTAARQGSICKPVATYWTFCNGGDLDFATRTMRSAGVQIPEAFIWRCFRQLLVILSYLHQLDPPVVHRDVFDCNIFLHWPTDTCKLPDFNLGDFGHSRVVGDKFTATTATATAASFSNDFSSVVFTIRRLLLGDASIEDSMSERDTGYSAALFEVCQKLDEMAAPNRRDTSQTFDLAEILIMVEDGISRAAEVTDDCVRRFMPLRTRTIPLLYDDRAEALEMGAHIVGPWQLAAVNSKTLKIIKVFPDYYATPKLPSPGRPIPQVPTNSNPAAGGMTWSQYLKQKKDETSTQGSAAKPAVYSMTSEDEKQLGLR